MFAEALRQNSSLVKLDLSSKSSLFSSPLYISLACGNFSVATTLIQRRCCAGNHIEDKGAEKLAEALLKKPTDGSKKKHTSFIRPSSSVSSAVKISTNSVSCDVPQLLKLTFGVPRGSRNCGGRSYTFEV
jgi:hypothetical protein